MQREFAPFANLWSIASKLIKGKQSWLYDQWETIDAINAEKFVEEGSKQLAQVVRFMRDRKIDGV